MQTNESIAASGAPSPLWKRIGSPITWKDVLLVVFLLALTFQAPIQTGSAFQISPVEIVALFITFGYVVYRLHNQPLSIGRIRQDWVALLLLVWGLWGGLVWLIVPDWSYNISEIRWVLLSAAVFLFILEFVQQDGSRVIGIFLGVSFFTALIADIQGLTGVFRPPFAVLVSKDIFTGVDTSFAHTVAVGFFQHPNAFGGFIYWPILISLGLASSRRTRWIGLIGLVFFGASLYLSYYRTLLLGLMFVIGLYFLLWRRLSPRLLAILFGALCALVVVLAGVALTVAPNISFFNNIWFRIRLWQQAFTFIGRSPSLLLFGSGIDPRSLQWIAQPRTDPHDAFIYMTVHYGIPGLVIFLVFICGTLQKGWRAYRDGILQKKPILAALWVGWIGWFLTDIIDSRLTTAEWQMLFVTVLAIYWGGLAAEENQPDSTIAPESTSPHP